jgi:hypothetical protein
MVIADGYRPPAFAGNGHVLASAQRTLARTPKQATTAYPNRFTLRQPHSSHRFHSLLPRRVTLRSPLANRFRRSDHRPFPPPLTHPAPSGSPLTPKARARFMRATRGVWLWGANSPATRPSERRRNPSIRRNRPSPDVIWGLDRG